MLSESQIQKLGLILNDEDNLKGSEYYATSISQYSDILFIGKDGLSSNECNCKLKDEEKQTIVCKERVMLIKTGFLTSMRVLQKEEFNSHITLGRVIRVIRILLKGTSNMPIDCIVHREMIQGFSVLFGILPDFNQLKVIQDVLRSYLFWCYMQSDDEYMISNSRILLCVTTWMKEVSVKDTCNENGTDPKYGLTLSSQELLNNTMIDFENCREQYFKEYTLIPTNFTNRDDLTLLDLEKRILRNLQLLSQLIKYAGVYDNSYNRNNNQNSLTKDVKLFKKNSSNLITTIIIPQVLEVLTKVRSLILELICYLIDEFINIQDNKKEEQFDFESVIKLINIIFIFKNGNNEQKTSILVDNQFLNDKFTDKLIYILKVSEINKEICSNLLKCSGKTGIVVYSHVIQEYIKSLFSTEFTSYSTLKLSNKEKLEKFVNKYGSSILLAFEIIPMIYLKDHDYELFLTWNSSIEIMKYFLSLFEEIFNIQEKVTEYESGKLKTKHQYLNVSSRRDISVNRLINECLLSSLSIYDLCMNVFLSLRQTRPVREFEGDESIDGLINKCHLSSINLLYNIVLKDCQLYSSSNYETSRFINADSSYKEFLLDLTLIITNVVVIYYENSDMIINNLVFNKIHEILEYLSFLLGGRDKDDRISKIFIFISSRLNNNNNKKYYLSNQINSGNLKNPNITILKDKDEIFHIERKFGDEYEMQSNRKNHLNNTSEEKDDKFEFTNQISERITDKIRDENEKSDLLSKDENIDFEDDQVNKVESDLIDKKNIKLDGKIEEKDFELISIGNLDFRMESSSSEED